MSAPQLRDDWQAIFRKLEPGWDSDDGNPITEAAIQTVLGFFVVPCSDGGIQMETHQDGYDIEICVGPDGRITDVLVERIHMSEWQPIETAPKDGTEVLLCDKGDTQSYVGFWHDGSQNYRKLAGWYELNATPHFILTDKPRHPTHWMPLPDPPHPGG